MKATRKLGLIVIVCVLLIYLLSVGCDSFLLHNTMQGEENYLSDVQLWEKVISPYLQDPLWISRDFYDAGHYLMVPLHAAFLFQNSDWQKQFRDHFERFLSASSAEIDLGRLNRLQYFYLISRYFVLAGQEKSDFSHLEELVETVEHEVVTLWIEEPAWQWAREPFLNMRDRVHWKLDNKTVEKSYYRAIIDEELFVFAIAADLSAFYHLSKKPVPPVVSDILETAKKVFEQEGQWQVDGGWLFQPGVWTDHPDYIYAGQTRIVPGMAPYPVPGIAQDTSHSHRFPLWFISLSGAYGDGDPEKEFYKNVREGLARQFFNKVLVPPTHSFPGYRTTNFMDGWNGVYRYEYVTQGKGKGYGPYELSGTLTLGWWTFLGGKEIRQVYQEMSKHFPMSPELLKIYVGPSTSRERHPLVSEEESYLNGFKELIVRLSGRIVAEKL